MVEWGYTGFTPMSVRPSVHPSVRPSICRQGFQIFFKNLLAQSISYLVFTLMGWVSWPLFIFVFLASFLALWWPIIWPKMVFPELFEKNIVSIHFIPGIYPYRMSLLTPIHFRVPSLIFGPLVAKYLVENRVSRTWIFLDEVGSDESGGILSPFMGTACSFSFVKMIAISLSHLFVIPYLIPSDNVLNSLLLYDVWCSRKCQDYVYIKWEYSSNM